MIFINPPTEYFCTRDDEEVQVVGQVVGHTAILFDKIGYYTVFERYNSWLECWEVLKIRKP